jgi:hypothetical protein
MAFDKTLFELAYYDEDEEPSRIRMRPYPSSLERVTLSLKDRAQRVLEEAAFRLWIGAGVAMGAFLAARYILQPKVERSPE